MAGEAMGAADQPVDEFEAFAAGELQESDGPPEEVASAEAEEEKPADAPAEATAEENGDEPDAEESAEAEEKEAPPAEEPPAEEPWRKLAKPGETPEVALARIASERDNYQGWARREQGNAERLREEMGGLRRAVEAMTPVYELVRKRLEAQAQPEPEPEPDPDKDPDRALLRKVDQIGQRLDKRERAEQEEAVARHWEAVDNAGWGVLDEGFQSDPEFAEAHDHVARTMYNVYRHDNPSATHDQAVEAVREIEMIHLRQRLARDGWTADQVRQDFKERAKLYGHRYELPASEPAPAVPAATNGKPAAPPLRRAAARQEAARGVSSPGPSGRASRSLPSVKDLTAMSEDELFDLQMDGKVTEEAILSVLAEG